MQFSSGKEKNIKMVYSSTYFTFLGSINANTEIEKESTILEDLDTLKAKPCISIDKGHLPSVCLTKYLSS